MTCWVTIIIAISENHQPTLTQSVKSSWGESWGTSAILSSLNLFRRTASSCHKVFGWQTPSSGSRDSGRSPAPLSPVLILAVLPPPVSHPGQGTPPPRRFPIEGPAKCRPAPPASTSWHPGTLSWCQLSYFFSWEHFQWRFWNCSLEDISLLFSQEIQERNRIFIILNLWRLSICICSNVDDAMMILMPFYSLTFHGLLFYLSLLVKLFFHESFSMIFTDNKQIDLKNKDLIIFGSFWCFHKLYI